MLCVLGIKISVSTKRGVLEKRGEFFTNAAERICGEIRKMLQDPFISEKGKKENGLMKRKEPMKRKQKSECAGMEGSNV